MTEEWREIPSTDGYYEASSLGRIRRVKRINGLPKNPPKILKPTPKPDGYLAFTACFNSREKPMTVHKAVAEAFHGPRPEGMECCHKNGFQLNNASSNLRWGTKAENTADTRKHGGYDFRPNGEKHGRAKLTEADVLRIRESSLFGARQADLAKLYGVKACTIDKIKTRAIWRHV